MQRSRVQVSSAPPATNQLEIGNWKSQLICVSSQIGSRHLPLKQGIVSSSLTWRTKSRKKSKWKSQQRESSLIALSFLPFYFCLFTCLFGVWCNASIRVLGTRGDSSILSSPTIISPKSNVQSLKSGPENRLWTLDLRLWTLQRIVGPVGSRHCL